MHNAVIQPQPFPLSKDADPFHRGLASPHVDHVSQLKPGLHAFPDRLYVVTAISNPVRYNRRYELYRAFEKHMADSGAILFTAECAFGGREFEVTQAGNPQHIQVRTNHELWHKENLLNLAISRLPVGWNYVAWVDADVTFARPNWAQETLHALQHYDVIQPWSNSIDLSPYGEVVPDAAGGELLPSMMHQYVNGQGWDRDKKKYSSKHAGHCGYAWAARRSAIDTLGQLMDFSILGANDHHMARALMGDVRNSVSHKMSKPFIDMLIQWEEHALELKKNIGYIPGTIQHHWHGPKKNRRYVDRWQILVEHQFDPYTDIKRDHQGLYQLSGNKIGLRDDIRKYFRQRNEDSIDVPA